MSPRIGASTPLSALIAVLQMAPLVPMPADEDWQQMLLRIAVPGRIAEVSEETYWHFLEVLPPRFIQGRYFCFAEGLEPLRLFWQASDRYFTRQLTWQETKVFCRAARIPQDYFAR
jgi:hypothetical protein